MTSRTCLLTGASGLLGTAFIRRHAASHRIIAVHSTRELEFASQHQSFVDPLDPERRLPSNDHAVHAIRADLAVPREVERVLDEAIAHSREIDVVICAASVRTAASLLSADSLAIGERILAVNVMAPLRLSAALARTIWGTDPATNIRRNRNIIHVSSTAGTYVYEDAGQAMFSGASAALDQLTYHLASELWDLGIRVNALLLPPAYDEALAERAAASLAELDRGDHTGKLLVVEVSP